MENIREYINSGIIEAYVLGIATPEERMEVEELAIEYIIVREAIDEFSYNLEQFSFLNAPSPDPVIKPSLLATIDYLNRIEQGEVPSFPPALNSNSTIADFAEWLNRPDMVLPDDSNSIYAKIIGHTPHLSTAIVWVKDMTPQEVHYDEYERFLIVEGTCIISIGDKAYNLSSGDYLTIPLFENHFVKVTSSIPCKVILQRMAA